MSHYGFQSMCSFASRGVWPENGHKYPKTVFLFAGATLDQLLFGIL